MSELRRVTLDEARQAMRWMEEGSLDTGDMAGFFEEVLPDYIAALEHIAALRRMVEQLVASAGAQIMWAADGTAHLSWPGERGEVQA